jgi:hypothetical protein
LRKLQAMFSLRAAVGSVVPEQPFRILLPFPGNVPASCDV